MGVSATMVRTMKLFQIPTGSSRTGRYSLILVSRPL